MSNELAKLSGGELSADIIAKLKEYQTDESERLGSAGGGDVISIKGKKFVLPSDQEVEEFEAHIVDFVYRNEYYIGAYNPNNIQPPACFAIAANAAEMAPSENSPVKQSQTDCNTCQQNQFGTSATGGGKACKNTVFLALLPPDDTEHDIWVLKTSPTAIRPFNKYASKVGQMGLPLAAVRTRLYFDPDSQYASVRFEAEGLDGDNIDALVARKEEAMKRLMEEPDVSQFEMPAAGR